MVFDCHIIDKEQQPVLMMRKRTTVEVLPTLLGASWGMLGAYLGNLGQAPAGPPYVGYFNMDMQDLEVEIGFPVAHPLAGKGEIEPGFFPGGKLATLLYTGPYQEMGPAYDALTEYVAANGFHPSGVSYEMYYNSPMDTAPEKLQTQIIFPLTGG